MFADTPLAWSKPQTQSMYFKPIVTFNYRPITIGAKGPMLTKDVFDVIVCLSLVDEICSGGGFIGVQQQVDLVQTSVP
jgi:hypothetical protein